MSGGNKEVVKKDKFIVGNKKYKFTSVLDHHLLYLHYPKCKQCLEPKMYCRCGLDKEKRYKCKKCQRIFTEKNRIDFHVQKECPYYIKERNIQVRKTSSSNLKDKTLKTTDSLQIPYSYLSKCRWCEEMFFSDTSSQKHQMECPKRISIPRKTVLRLPEDMPIMKALIGTSLDKTKGKTIEISNSMKNYKNDNENPKLNLFAYISKERQTAEVAMEVQAKEELQNGENGIDFETSNNDIIIQKYTCELCRRRFSFGTGWERHLKECPMRVQITEEVVYENDSVEGGVEIKEEPPDEDYEIGPGNTLDTESIKTEPVDTIFEVKCEPEELVFGTIEY